MKRYLLLFLSTALVIGTLTAAGFALKPKAVSVRTWKLQSTSAVDTLLCTGTVKRENEKEILFTQNIQIEEVFAAKGAKVSAGQALFSYRIVSSSNEPSQQQTYAQMWEEYQNTGKIPDNIEEILTESGEPPVLEEGELLTATSPIDGSITDFDVQQGQILSIGKTAAVIADPDNLKIELQVNEANISKVQVGQRAEITGSGFPEREYQAEVSSISEEAVVQTSASGKESVVEVILKVLDADEKIKPGYTVKASVVTENLKNTIQIPYSAIFADEDGNEYIYTVKDNRAALQPITAIKEYSSGVTIEEPLEEGVPIIMEPDRVQEGDYIKCFETEAFAYD